MVNIIMLGNAWLKTKDYLYMLVIIYNLVK
jgi:hypothetical protein